MWSTVSCFVREVFDGGGPVYLLDPLAEIEGAFLARVANKIPCYVQLLDLEQVYTEMLQDSGRR